MMTRRQDLKFSLAHPRPAVFAGLVTLVALGAQLALMPSASAQIVAYKAAPANQQPAVLTAGNGVPLVNIQTPSAAGVSRNTYGQFDVDAKGAILNNARNNALTQLGGWVQGNPWLAGGSARVILNEVIAANPSQLLGYVEVAGSPAQVVVANPAGITCNGCGFINASRATLTTGTPTISGGNLDGYRVEGGTIRVEGTGLDTSHVGYTDLIARAVEINAGLWAQTLKVTAGSNAVNADNTQATPITPAVYSGPAPAFSIDVAKLGGLYAGKIVLVGTEAGVGVRNAGNVGASAGEVVVTVDGRLMNSGSLMASGDISLATPSDVQNSGLVSAGGTLSVAAARVINTDTLDVSQGLEGRALAIDAGTIDNRNGALRADTTLTLSSSGSLDNRNGLIASAQNVNVRDMAPTKTLAITNTSGTLIAGQQLDIDSASLGGDGKLLSKGDLALKLAGDFTNAGASAEITANGGATLEIAGAFTNQATLQAGTALGLTAAGIDNQTAGQILAPELRLAATGSHTLTNRGLIDGNDTRIDAGTLDNLGTARIYGDHLSIAAITLNNIAEGATAPVIAARDRLDLAVGTLNNRDESVLFSAGDLAIGGTLDGARRATGTAGTVNNVSATIEALADVSIDADTLNNKRRTLVIARELKDSASRSYTVCEDPPDCDYIDYLTETTTHYQDNVTSTSPAASILASHAMRITADSVVNEYATLQSGGDLTLTGTTLANTGAELFLQTDVARSGYWRHWGRDPHALPTSYSSTSVKTGSVDAVISAGGDLTGSFTDRIDSLTIREHTAPVVPGSGTRTDSGASIAPVDTALPASSLFRTNPDPDGRYLIETDPRFTSYREWLGSDYLLSQIDANQAITQKRLGDGFYEQRLINEQVGQLTGRRFLTGYANEEEEYRALMDAGVAVARQWHLVPGVALSAEQVAQLTSDIVWLVAKEVAGQKVLVPQVYVRLQPGDLAPSGAVLGGNNVRLDAAKELATSGTIAGRQLVMIDADRIQNLRGQIQGTDVDVRAQTDLLTKGGTFSGRDRLNVSAGRDLTVESSTVDQHYRRAGRVTGSVDKTVVDRVAGLYVTGDGGTLAVSAGNDLKLQGAAVASAGSAILTAGHDLTLGTVGESSQAATVAKRGYWRQNSNAEIGSTVQTSGNLTLLAGNDLSARAASVTSDRGAIVGQAGRDLTIEAGQARTLTETYSKSSKRSLLGSRSKVRRDTVEDVVALASTISGESTTLIAGRDMAVKGSNIVATQDTTLLAAGNIALVAAAQAHNETHFVKTKQSGVFSSGGIGVTIGSKQQSTDQKTDATLAAKSTVGSLEGNVTLIAGETYRQVGSDVISPQGNIDITAKTVDIVEARQTSRTVTETKFKQSGLTLALSSPVITAIQTAQQMSQAAGDTKDSRMKLLAAANIGLSANNAIDAIKAGQGTTINGKEGQILTGKTNADGSAETRDATAADQVGGINISLSLGSSKSQSKSTQTSDTAVVSNLTAGRDLTITATGAGSDSDITLQGAQAKAGRNIILTAEDEIKLLAAKNTFDQHSTNKSSSASVGIGFALGGTQNGFTIQAGVSGGRGKADGADLSWTNTHVEAGNVLSLSSGGDTTLKGAVASGKQVIANVGKNLLIESLQDTSTYDSKQKSLGASVSLCIPPFCVGTSSGSISASNSKVKSDYASVAEQSGLRAGDGGFTVDAQGNTDLQGGAITSTQKAIDENLNRFETGGTLTTRDIQNRASYSAKSMSVNLGTSLSLDGKLAPGGTGMGLGKDSGNASSTTQAAISDIAGNKAARTGDAETGIGKIFDQDKVQKEIDAQTKITQMFGQLASKAVGDYATSKLKEAGALRDQAAKEPDDARARELRAQADEIDGQWGPQGSLRIAAHTVIGGLTGGVSGAAGAAAGTLTAPLVAAELKKAGIDGPLATALTALASTAVGATVGGTAGAGAALNEVANNYLKHDEAVRMAALQSKKALGLCGPACQQEIDALKQTDEQRNAVLEACQGVSNAGCDAARQEVRNAAAEYIRKETIALNQGSGYSLLNVYATENREARQYADRTLDGRASGVVEGATGTVVDAAKAVGSLVGNLTRSAFGDESSQQALKAGASAAWGYVRNPDNWPYLLGAMTPDQREQLAQAYEKGDGSAIGRLMGEQAVNILSNVPSGGAAGAIKIVKAADKIEDVASALTKAEKAGAKGWATGANEAVFWSGLGPGGVELAAEWVAQNGGVTLESTLASRRISLPAWDASNPSVVAAWRQASIGFAAGARGDIRVLQGDFIRFDAIWRDEFLALRPNPNVTSIRSINPTTGAEVLLWKR